MKYLFIAIVLFASCQQTQEDKAQVIHDTTAKVQILKDSPSLNTITKQTNSADSAIYYFSKEMDSKITADSFEIAYYRTGNEKLRIKCNKYRDSIHYYYLLLHNVATRK